MQEQPKPEIHTPKYIDKHREVVGFALSGSFLLFYLIIVVLVIINSLNKNKEIQGLKSELSILTYKYNGLEQQLGTEMDAKQNIEKALDSVQRAPKFVKFETIGPYTQKIAEVITPNSNTSFTKLILQSNYGQGEYVTATLYALADSSDLEKTVKIAETNTPASFLGPKSEDGIEEAREFILEFGQKVDLYSENSYMLVIAVSSPNTQVGIAYTQEDTNSEGELYIQKLNPAEPSITPTWQQKVAEDLYFRLE